MRIFRLQIEMMAWLTVLAIGCTPVRALQPTDGVTINEGVPLPTPAPSAPSSGLKPSQLAVLVNDNDPYSTTVAAYYQAKRNIPSANFIHLQVPMVASLTRDQFAAIEAQINAALRADIQAVAIAWTTPSRVECNSMTSAVSKGFQSGPCDDTTGLHTCSFASGNAYYNTNSVQPFTDFGFRPSMMLAARSVSDAEKMIDNGVASDGTNPTGTAYVMNTSDPIRSLRARAYSAADLGTAISPYVNVEIDNAEYVAHTTDALFYFQGLASVDEINTNSFPPGAIADNLTSFGGRLTDSTQMSILQFIAGGVTGTFGTVSEPCAEAPKFPNPAIVIQYYTQGETLIEAYWKSVSEVFQGEFVGEPLANPWRK